MPEFLHRIGLDVVLRAVLAQARVGEVGMDGHGDVARQRPGRRRPHQEGAPGMLAQRQADEDSGVGDLLVPLGDDLMFRDPGGAARAPGHHVVPLVDQPPLPALLQEVPDRVVVLVGHRVVGVVPIHPVAQANGLLRLDPGEPADPLLAALDELGDAERFDVPLGLETQLLFDLDLHPEPLAVEPVLVALPVAEHGVVALEEVLVGAAPGVVHAHRVVGRDRPVEEGPAHR